MQKLLLHLGGLLPCILLAQPDSLDQRIAAASGPEKARRISDAVFFYLRSDVEKAAFYEQMAAGYAARHPADATIQAYALLNKGVLYNARNAVDSAIYFLEEALDKKAEDDALNIKILAALGKCCITDARTEKGLDYLFSALKLLERQPDPVDEMKVHSNIMWAYLELKRYRDCIRYGRMVLKNHRHPQSEWIIPYITNNMAASYGALSQPDSVRYYVELGIPIAEATHNNAIIANGYFILGNLYATLGLYQQAVNQFEKARPYRAKTGDVFYQIADLYVMSELYYKMGDYHQGIQVGLEGMRLAEEKNLILKFEGVYQALARNYEALGDFKNAAKYYRLLASAKDSVYQKANAEALAEMETRYETEKKEMLLAEQQLKIRQSQRLIAFLVIISVLIVIIILIAKRQQVLKAKQRLTEREKEFQEALTQSVIASQERERARFARDLHDGLGQLISSIRLIISGSREEWVGHVNQLLDTIHQEIRNLAFALLPRTLTTDGLAPALQELAHRLNASGKIRVHVSANGAPARLPSETEVSLYRVAQEWLSNVMRHAHATEVHINLHVDEDEATLIIEDNGEGFDTALLLNGKGHGWKNICSRVNTCRGEVTVDSTPGTVGTTLIVTVPAQTLHLKVA